jgi:hypothetical protein
MRHPTTRVLAMLELIRTPAELRTAVRELAELLLRSASHGNG